MHDGDDPSDAPPEDEPFPGLPDPEEIRRRHRERRTPSAGLVYLRSVTAEESEWMRRMVTRVARAHNVDREDLLQELREALLSCDDIDRGRTGLRAWLTQRASWKAADLLRRETRHSSRSTPLDEAPAEPVAREPIRGADWTPPPSWRLSRSEAQIVCLVCWGYDISMRDLAELVDRTHAAVRQTRSRVLRRIEDLFDLEPEERAAFIARREFGTHAAAAVRLGLAEDELRARVRRAETKIRQALGRTDLHDTDDDSHEEDTRDGS